jgi:hypothetical protein
MIMIGTPEFLDFRDEVYIAENGEGYKTSRMRNSEYAMGNMDYLFPVPCCPVKKNRQPETGHSVFSFDRVNSTGL